jgi:hypothetical protein
MTQITIDIKPETARHIHAMLPNHPGLTFPQLAGAMLDKQVAYRLEVERMKPALIQHVGEDWL